MTSIDQSPGITAALPASEALFRVESDLARAQEKVNALEGKRAAALALRREYQSKVEDLRRRRDELLVARDKASQHREGAAAAREAALGILGDRFTPWFQAGCKLVEASDAERCATEIERVADQWEDELLGKQRQAESFRVEHGLPAAETQT
ncbi:MAG: hypothetical protein KF791_20415 [Verrucomicrobiae bacterium]|nr:hypothetical protein [Verrucomicrobiae bacterium]